MGAGRSPELAALIGRRRALGLDLFDEEWEGAYHVSPAAHPWHGLLDQQVAVVFQPLVEAVGLTMSGPFNLGEPHDYRVPDRGIHREVPSTVWVSSAPLVVEVLSPDDESLAKLGFYAARGVDEVVIVDPERRSVSWLALTGDRYHEVDRSTLLGVGVAEVARFIAFPAAPQNPVDP